ncbi:MAG: hypothetical protein NTW72_12325, partial [Gemmatimonadetes bacterium]|nr:hypothetical protein [Gemmatimonadota bacterium]
AQVKGLVNQFVLESGTRGGYVAASAAHAPKRPMIAPKSVRKVATNGAGRASVLKAAAQVIPFGDDDDSLSQF